MAESAIPILQMSCVLGVTYGTMKLVMEKKKRMWFLTSISSLLMSACGLVVCFRIAQNGLTHELSRPETKWDRRIAEFFCAYCLTDLFAGSLDYREFLDWQAGWTHHVFYLGALLLTLERRHTVFFTAGLIEELPTVYLAYARMNSTSPHSSFFAYSFFILRILYHTIVTFEILQHSTLAFFIGLVVLRAHLWWFANWWRGVAEPDGRRPVSRWSLRSKLMALGSMVLVQIVTMLHVSYSGYKRRDWLFSFSPLFLFISYVYFGFQTIAIFVDTYTKSFIKLAIAEKQLIYNISWEDPRVEREALKLSSDDVVLTISSAGCNVLDYLVEDPKHVVAADLNEAQLAVLDLKLACMRAHMSHADFFALWGRSDPRIFNDNYRDTLRDKLSREASREFWDEIRDSLFADNFMFTGTSGLMAYMLMLAARPLGVSGALQRNLGRPPSSIDSLVFKTIISFLSWPFVWTYFAPLIGVPPEQVALVERRPELFSERIEEILTKRVWLEDNYFYHGYCTGQFDSFPKCPRYMAEHFYNRLVANKSYEKVTLFHGSWGDADFPRNDKFTFVSLLDSMDWMPPSLVADLLSNLLPRCTSNVQIFWRSYAPGPSLEIGQKDLFTPHSPALSHLEPTEVEDYDRVGFYMSQWVSVGASSMVVPLGTASSNVTPNTLLDDARVCLAMAAHALRPKKDVATFYKSQGPRYDGFREALLPDRDTLMKYALPWSRRIEAEYALACVGCGTARDLEYVSEHLVKNKKRIALVDLSPELLAVAKTRVHDLGLDDLVDFFNVDCTDLKQVQSLVGNCAFVTCSYCLTMIPDWRLAIQNLTKMVAPGGYLGVVDFTTRFNREHDLLEKIYKKWFSLDGVYFDRNHVNQLADSTTPYFYIEARSRVPYTPYYPTHYVYVGQRTTTKTTSKKKSTTRK